MTEWQPIETAPKDESWIIVTSRAIMTTPDEELARADIEAFAARHGQPVERARFWRNVWLGRTTK